MDLCEIMIIRLDELRRLIRNSLLSESGGDKKEHVGRLIKEYKREFREEIFQKNGGNCAFFAWHFGRWASEQGAEVSVLFCWHDTNLPWKKDGDPSDEDHVVACVNGYLVDFVHGLPKAQQRSENRERPDVMGASASLFQGQGYYAKLGYHCYWLERSPRFESSEKIQFSSWKKGSEKGAKAPWPPSVDSVVWPS